MQNCWKSQICPKKMDPLDPYGGNTIEVQLAAEDAARRLVELESTPTPVRASTRAAALQDVG